LRFVKLILFISIVNLITSCDELSSSLNKPTYLKCIGTVDRGVIGNDLQHHSVEIIKSDITLKISKSKIDVKGDGTQLEFLSDKTICSNDEEIRFESNNCETPSQQLERLVKVYNEDSLKVKERKDYENHHKVFGFYNKINKSFFMFSEDSLCYKETKSKSCGNYNDGKYQCEIVKNLD
jgi:hypothetical protein